MKTNKKGKIFIGKVVSDKMDNTITIEMSYTRRHPIYKKIVTKHKKIYADNNLSAKMGDTVKVREVKPISKIKRFTTLEILKSSLEIKQ
jgi:small subunit ribosomal protein S17